MREYVIVLIGSVLVCSLAVMLSPEGEKGMAQYVKLAAGLCVLCVLISPLTSFVSSISELIEQNRSFDGIDNSLDNFEKIYNESLLDASGEEIANALESMLCREFGFKNDEIDVYVELCEGEDGYLPECVTVALWQSANTLFADPHDIIEYVNGLLDCRCEIIYG